MNSIIKVAILVGCLMVLIFLIFTLSKREKYLKYMNYMDVVQITAKASYFEKVVDELQNLVDQEEYDEVIKKVVIIKEKIKKMRSCGLEHGGEFSTENLVFKTLRHNGYLEKLATCKTKAFDRELSIEDEEWSNLC